MYYFYAVQPLKILLLTHRVPHPLTDGGAIVTNNMIQELLNQPNVELGLLSLNTTKHYVAENELPNYYNKLKYFKTVNINNSVTVMGALLNLFTNKSYHMARFKNVKFSKLLMEVTFGGDYDWVIADNIYIAGDIIDSPLDINVAVRMHNIEHNIWQGVAKKSKNIFKKWYLLLQTKRLQKAEVEILQRAKLLLPLNENEIAALPFKVNNYYHLPYVTTVALNTPLPTPQKAVYHLASMNWQPNVTALDWFIEKVWPLVLLQDAAFTLNIAGKDMPTKYTNNASKNIVVDGFIPDANVYMHTKGICIVPLLSGAGIRVKIVEALAAGVPVVSTALGAMGLPLNDREIIIADTPQEFANGIIHAYTNFEKYSAAAFNAATNKMNSQDTYANFVNYLRANA